MKNFITVFKFMFYILIFLLGIVFSFILTLAFDAIISIIQSILFAKDNYIFISSHNYIRCSIFIFEVACIYFILYFIFRYVYKINFINEKFSSYKRYKLKILVGIFIIFVLIVYYDITAVSVFYNDKVNYHNFFIPQGKEYSYVDVSQIDTGFNESDIPFIKHKGDFYYNITIKDGTIIDVYSSSGLSIKDDKDVYLTLKQLDEIFVKTGAEKIVDSKYFNIGVKDLDKIYANRIRSILLNIR